MIKINSKTNTLGWLAAVIWVSNLILYIFAYSELEESLYFIAYTDILPILWAFLSMVLFFMVAKIFEFKGSGGYSWILLSTGLMLWLVGEIMWMFYEVILQIEAPYPSLADTFWFIGYIFLTMGLIFQLKLIQMKLNKTEIAILYFIIIGIVALAFYYILIPIFETPIVEDLDAEDYFSLIEKILALSYPIFDLTLFSLGAVLVVRYRGGDYSKAWLLISIGFIISAAYDLVFSYFSMNNFEGYDIYMDHIYLIFYMFFTVGASFLYEKLKAFN